MLEELVVFLAASEGQTFDVLPSETDGWGKWFFERAFLQNQSSELISVAVSGRSLPLVGVGAPAELLARELARRLRMPFSLPAWSSVANAVGAVAGSIVVSKEAIIYRRESSGTLGYSVQVEGTKRTFEEESLSLDYAKRAAHDLALEAAHKAGAAHPRVSLRLYDDGSLQRVEARAIGNPLFNNHEVDSINPTAESCVFELG